MPAASVRTQSTRGRFATALRAEADAAFAGAGLAVVGAGALSGVMLIWALFGEDVIEYFGEWLFWVSGVAGVGLSIAVMALLSRSLMPRFTAHVRRVLIDQGLLLDVLSDDARERFPLLAGRLARAQWVGLRIGKPPSAEPAGSFARQMRQFLLNYTHCCQRRHLRPWPLWWPSGCIPAGCTLSLLAFLLGLAFALFGLWQPYALFGTPPESIEGARGVGLLYLGVFVPIGVVALIAALQDCAKSRGLAAALEDQPV